MPNRSRRGRRRDHHDGPAARLAPDWLLQPEVALCPCGCIGKRRKGGFVAKTLTGVAQRGARRRSSGRTSPRGSGLLQQLDARVKVVALLGLLVVAAFVAHDRRCSARCTLGAVVLALASRAPARVLHQAGLAVRADLHGHRRAAGDAQPRSRPGTIVVPLGTWFGHRSRAHRRGAGVGAASSSSGSRVSISLVVLLTLTTPWTRLLAALRSLVRAEDGVLVLGDGVPLPVPPARSVDGHVHRSHGAHRRRRVAASRRGGGSSPRRPARCSARPTRCRKRCYLAMVARGYTGNVRTLTAVRVRRLDALSASAVRARGRSSTALG